MLVPIAMPHVQAFRPMNDEKLARLIYLLSVGRCYLSLSNRKDYDFSIRAGERDLYFRILPNETERQSLSSYRNRIPDAVCWVNVTERDLFKDAFAEGCIYQIVNCPATDYRIILKEYRKEYSDEGNKQVY